MHSTRPQPQGYTILTF